MTRAKALNPLGLHLLICKMGSLARMVSQALHVLKSRQAQTISAKPLSFRLHQVQFLRYSVAALTRVPPSSVFTAETRQKLRDDELRREYYEEQRNEFENFVEEQRDGKLSALQPSGCLGGGERSEEIPGLPSCLPDAHWRKEEWMGNPFSTPIHGRCEENEP